MGDQSFRKIGRTKKAANEERRRKGKVGTLEGGNSCTAVRGLEKRDKRKSRRDGRGSCGRFQKEE